MSKRKGLPRWATIVGVVIGTLVVLYVVLMAVMPRAGSSEAMAGHSWQVIAHQGGNQLRPGDTMEAFSHAVALGVDALELDVHGTADGVLVVIHDETVDRTTEGTGPVSEKTLVEI